MHQLLAALPALLLAVASVAPVLADDQLIAIDVLLKPGPKMLREASAWNARMRQQFPNGFELDALHTPHITLLQRYIAASDLDKVLAAVEAAGKRFDLTSMQMTATGLYHIPAGEIGLAGIVVEPSEDLHQLQQAMIDTVAPYAKAGGTEAAFAPDTSGAPFDPSVFSYVENFVPDAAGEKYNPHVTVGIAPRVWLQEIEGQPFERFTFGAEGLATYQMGNFGTAALRLGGT